MKIRTGMKKVWLIFLLAFVMLFLVACSDNVAKEYANKLYIANHDEITGSFALPKYVEGNKEAPVTWESSNPEVVSIGEIPEWEHPEEGDKLSPTPDLYYKATVVLQSEATNVILKATVTVGNKTAIRDMKITVVADEFTAMTIEEVKEEASKNDKVKIEGTVIFVADSGYAIKDDTGHIFMYGSNHGRKIGDKVVVRGRKDVYNNMPQLSGSTSEKLGEEKDFDPYAELEEITLEEIMDHPVNDAHFYTKLYKIKGRINKTDDSNNPYHIVDPVNQKVFVGITKYTSNVSKDDIENYVGKYVEMVILIYSNYQGNYSVCYVENTAKETEIVYTEKQKVEITLQKMLSLLAKDKGLAWDIELPTTDSEFDATIKWESSNKDILTNDGKFTAPDKETTLELTVEVTVGKTTMEETIKLTAYNLPVTEIHDLIPMTPLKNDDEKPLVLIAGKVIGYQYNGYWIGDETGNVLVYSSNRPEIGEIVQVRGNLTAYKPNESFNMQINPIEYRVLKDAEEPTIIAPIEMTFEEIFALGVDSQEKAVEVAADYYGKLITISGKVRGSGNFWFIDGETEGQFFRLNNLQSNAGLVEGQEVTITVIVRDIYYVKDSSGYDNFLAGTFGGAFFNKTDIVVNK